MEKPSIDYQSLWETTQSKGWKEVIEPMLIKDIYFSESLLLDHGAIDLNSKQFGFKLKSDKEIGFQLGCHKVAKKYYDLAQKAKENLNKNGGR